MQASRTNPILKGSAYEILFLASFTFSNGNRSLGRSVFDLISRFGGAGGLGRQW